MSTFTRGRENVRGKEKEMIFQSTKEGKKYDAQKDVEKSSFFFKTDESCLYVCMSGIE